MSDKIIECKNERDLYHIMYGRKYLPIQKDSAKNIKEAKRLWKKFAEENPKTLKKYGFLEIVSDNQSFSVKRRSPGRPVSDTRKEYKKTIRMDKETVEKLDEYCRTNNIKVSEAVRLAVRKL